MDKKKVMYAFMFCFSVGSILLIVDGYAYYNQNATIDTDLCGCVHEELKPYLCNVRFVPFSSFAVANYFYFFGVISLMLYRDIPSLTEVYRLLKNKYLQKKK